MQYLFYALNDLLHEFPYLRLKDEGNDSNLFLNIQFYDFDNPNIDIFFLIVCCSIFQHKPKMNITYKLSCYTGSSVLFLYNLSGKYLNKRAHIFGYLCKKYIVLKNIELYKLAKLVELINSSFENRQKSAKYEKITYFS